MFLAHCFPSESENALSELTARHAFHLEMFSTRIHPNKAPEPTTTAVTRRAFECALVLERDIRARRAPAVVVAHL